jgi:hypothetical protein
MSLAHAVPTTKSNDRGRAMSVLGSTPEDICAGCVLLILTHLGSRAAKFAALR